MFKNLFRVAVRNFRKDKAYTLLNLFGLTIGIGFSLLLIFYVLDELSFDRYNKKADRIYRIVAYINEPENHMKWASTQSPLGPELKKEYPDVEYSTRIAYADRVMYKKGDSKNYEEKIFYADSALFKIFTYEFLEGNPNTALDAPKSIVMTQSLAEKYFGKNRHVLGQSFENDHKDVYKITGVIKDVPKHSHLIFNALISASTLPPDYRANWGGFGGVYTYVLLKPNVDPKSFEKKLLALYDKFMAPIFAQYNIKIHYGVQPLTSIHLHSDFNGEPEEVGSMSYIYIFSAVALFMLLIACINYMNLTTARSARRAKEIGIRKVTGSTQGQLVAQFLLESVLLTIAALILSLGLVYLALPVFNNLSGKSISLASLINPQTLLILFLIVLFVGLLGGSYPAFYLSKFNPVSVLKGSLAKGSSNTTLRRVLVVAQFSISMTMLICTWVVYSQLKYVRTIDLGFIKDQMLTVPIDLPGNNSSKVLAFKNQVKQIAQVKSASTANSVPGGGLNFQLFSIEGKNGYTQKGVDCYDIDEDYLPTLGIRIVKGRNFTGATDTLRSIIVNEEMVKQFGWEEPLGKKVKFPGDTSNSYVEVVGVVKDFHQKSLYNPITPLLLFYRPNTNNVQIRLSASNISTAVSAVESVWKANFQDAPFQYKFLDQDFDSQYAADKKRGKIFVGFSVLTIIITCLGLLGLIAFTTEQRQKEISIRKVMGASLSGLAALIIRNFVFLVLLSCLIAFPVAWYFMHKWLDLFPYKEGLRPMTFILSALVVLLIAVLTVSFHTIKVALANPVKALRSE